MTTEMMTLTEEELQVCDGGSLGEVLCTGAGGYIGAKAGAEVGAAIGSSCGPVGSVIGGVAGAVFGACMGFTAGACVGAYHVCTGSEPAQMGRDLVTGTLCGTAAGLYAPLP